MFYLDTDLGIPLNILKKPKADHELTISYELYFKLLLLLEIFLQTNSASCV